MKEKRLLHLVEQIDETYIAEAAPESASVTATTRVQKKAAARPLWMRWSAIAAAFVLLAGVVTGGYYIFQKDDYDKQPYEGVSGDKPNYNEFQVIQQSVDVVGYNSISEMEDASEYIIRCTISGLSKNHVHLSDVEIEGKMYTLDVGGKTVTPVEVTEVYKGDLEVGQIIYISEPYHFYEPMEGYSYMSTVDGYLPMLEGNEYILYLFHNGEMDDDLKEQYAYTQEYGGLYQIVGTYQGKYVIDEDMQPVKDFAFSDEQMQIFESDERYRKLFAEVMRKIALD